VGVYFTYTPVLLQSDFRSALDDHLPKASDGFGQLSARSWEWKMYHSGVIIQCFNVRSTEEFRHANHGLGHRDPGSCGHTQGRVWPRSSPNPFQNFWTGSALLRGHLDSDLGRFPVPALTLVSATAKTTDMA
jgi:hypothetical protein